MAFSPKVWQNSPSTATPINAAALIDLETRLSAYTDANDLTPSVGLTNVGNVISVTYGTTSGTAAQGNDSRFTKTTRETHSFVLGGTLGVASGSSDLTYYIPPFFVSKGSSEVNKNIVWAKYVIGTGTSATCAIQRNGTNVTGFTGLVASTTAGQTTGSQAISDGDMIAVVITAISGSPANLSFSIAFESTVT